MSWKVLSCSCWRAATFQIPPSVATAISLQTSANSKCERCEAWKCQSRLWLGKDTFDCCCSSVVFAGLGLSCAERQPSLLVLAFFALKFFLSIQWLHLTVTQHFIQWATHIVSDTPGPSSFFYLSLSLHFSTRKRNLEWRTRGWDLKKYGKTIRIRYNPAAKKNSCLIRQHFGLEERGRERDFCLCSWESIVKTFPGILL